jgi:predicted dehydrogenase
MKNTSSPKHAVSRRRFLQQAGLLGAAPFLLPSHIWAAPTPPNSRITLGLIGIGIQSRGHLTNFLNRAEVQVLAVCDVDRSRREEAKRKIEERYAKVAGKGYQGCAAYNDFRDLLARQDIDAVIIGTPDHWHAIIALAALRAGKDVYCEKPLTHNIREAVELVKVTRQFKRILQTGSQQRSSSEFRVACELIRNNRIGRLQRIEVRISGPARPNAFPAQPLEPGLDWDLWCGPGPLVPYSSELSPRGFEYKHFPAWRKTREFGGGGVCDWGAHHIDIAQWALGEDGRGPVEVIAPEKWEQAEMGARLIYGGGVPLHHLDGPNCISFYGADGEVHVSRRQFKFILQGKVIHKFWDKDEDQDTTLGQEILLTEQEYLAEAKVKLYRCNNHHSDWLDAIKTRKEPICDVAIGASSAIACHLMNCAYYYGAKAKWDPVKHVFVSGGDAQWLTRNYRGLWKV